MASIKRDGTWYCSTACSEGRPSGTDRAAVVPDPWLYSRPRRFFEKRRPKELRNQPV